MTFVSTLEPQPVWRHFDQILTIPRGSKEEGAIRQHVIEIAVRTGLEYTGDDAGNIVVRKPATAGREGAPVTILQSHLDMVNEKNSDVDHDFSTDPIEPKRDGDYVTARGTTLGSDNGIGVAAMLALMEANDVAHGPLELLFTIDEETGLTGASNLDGGLLTGRRLLNLDSEEEGALYVGCAGGADSTLTLPLDMGAAPARAAALDITLHGLKGGHSGIDIILQRGNAVQLLARMLYAVARQVPLQLNRIQGGNKHNAIPREASARVIVAEPQLSQAKDLFAAEFEAVSTEFAHAEPHMGFEATDAAVAQAVWTAEASVRALRLLIGLPHGVVAMSYDIPDLVETSTNLATVVTRPDALVIGMSSRSSTASALMALRRRIRAIGELAGAAVEEGNGYPGWKPDLESEVLRVLKQVHLDRVGNEQEIKAIHAGLECGIIGEKVSGMDMISFGPQIEFPHSPDERVHIESVERFYGLLVAALDRLSVNA
jgi:dipeptidase D